jgi:hypothetical protein
MFDSWACNQVNAMTDPAKENAEVLADMFQELGYGTELHQQSVPPHGWLVILKSDKPGKHGYNVARIVLDDRGHIMVDWDEPKGFVERALSKHGLTKYLVSGEPEFKTLEILGRRWFQRSGGNTYHTAEIVVDGEVVHKTGKAYGYGDQYVQSAAAWLAANGYVSPLWAGKPLWQLRDEYGIKYRAEAINVPRERDL